MHALRTISIYHPRGGCRRYLNRAHDDDYRLLVAFRYGVVLVTVRSRYHADLSPDILAHDSGLT